MANPLKSMQRTREEYRSMDRLDRHRFWSDSILNNALYILMFVFVVYTANQEQKLLSPGLDRQHSSPSSRPLFRWRSVSRAVSS